jgi:hypothetical protein
VLCFGTGCVLQFFYVLRTFKGHKIVAGWYVYSTGKHDPCT